MGIIRPVFLTAATVVVLLTAYGITREETALAMKSESVAVQEEAGGAEFQAMLVKLDAAQQEFHNGRPAALKALGHTPTT